MSSSASSLSNTPEGLWAFNSALSGGELPPRTPRASELRLRASELQQTLHRATAARDHDLTPPLPFLLICQQPFCRSQQAQGADARFAKVGQRDREGRPVGQLGRREETETVVRTLVHVGNVSNRQTADTTLVLG